MTEVDEHPLLTVRVILKPAGDAPLLPPQRADWPLALARGATWAELRAAVHALLRAHSAAGWGGGVPQLYVGSAGGGYTPFVPACEQRVVDLLAAFALRVAPRGMGGGAEPAPPDVPLLVLSYSRAAAW